MKKLKWGETPWEKLDRDELLREVQRLYSAGLSMACCLKMARASDVYSPYWGPRGSGGRALAKWDTINEPLEKKFGNEEIYRAFYRYADDLLFSPGLGSNWVICDVCGGMLGNPEKPAKAHVEHCFRCEEDRQFRPIEWKDLRMEK